MEEIALYTGEPEQQITVKGGGAKPAPVVEGSSYNTISNFLSQVRTTGLSKANRFEVDVFLPDYVSKIYKTLNSGIVSLMCETAFMPQARVLTGRQQLFGPPEFFPVGVDYGGDNIGLNFYLDREYRVKRFFDAWINSIIVKQNPDSASPNFVARYSKDYRSRVNIKQLDEQDNVMYAVQLIDAFPVATNVITLDQGLQNQVNRINVSFNYRYWVEMDVKPPRRPLATKGFLDDLLGIFNSANPIESPSLKPGFDPFHPETSPANQAYYLKK